MKRILIGAAAVLITFILILFAVTFGAVRISPDAILSVFTGLFTGETGAGLHKAQLILLKLRLPRVLLAAIAGAGLGISGAVFQGVFRNPLAEPYLLGVSSGAALGATLAFVFTFDMVTNVAMGLGGVTIAAFGGAIGSTLLVFFLAGGVNRDFSFLLLAGIAMSYIFQAVISFLMMMNRNELDRIIFWMMGSFSSASWPKVITSGVFVFIASLFLILNGRRLNILSLGNQEAFSLGLDPRKTGLLLLSVASLITASVISVSGIIGFVGLLVPHMVRYVTGPDHRKVLPYSALAGALLLVYADLAARTLIPPKEIPIGVITALIGGPFFLIQLKFKSWRRGV
ncbi:MAG: iron ABC transporter permease [Spirochaetales bacterium]|nr:iron ABC transporter permease [Spirochaetales bacterium]